MGESIAQRPQRSREGGFWMGAPENSIGNTVPLSGRRNERNGGKRRTEATEVTEGGFGMGAQRILSVTPWLPAGETSAMGESIAQRPQRSQRGDLGLVARNSIGDTAACWARNKRQSGKASHRGHRGHRGGIWDWWPEILAATPRLPGGETRAIGESIAQRPRGGHRGGIWDWGPREFVIGKNAA